MPRDVPPVPHRRLGATIAPELRRQIEAGRFRPGERLNEATLAQDMGTSRGPIREAIRVLAGMGLVIPVPNRGVFVRQVSLEETRDLYEVRALIFGFAVARATASRTPARMRALEALVERMDRAADAGRGSAYYALNLKFHAAVLRYAGNRRAARTYLECVNELHLFRRPAFEHEAKMRRSNREHRRILAAMAAGRAAEASRIASAHVLAAGEQLLAAGPNP